MATNQHISTSTIVKVLQQYYGLSISDVAFLSIGNDPNTSVFKVTDRYNKK